ncbi:hypothetical protein DOT_3948 [Desulfosporosinus sp. OT]|nr:hypothetical protein DOT_3948 [Desulfosporosinus sp. OT]
MSITTHSKMDINCGADHDIKITAIIGRKIRAIKTITGW